MSSSLMMGCGWVADKFCNGDVDDVAGGCRMEPCTSDLMLKNCSSACSLSFCGDGWGSASGSTASCQGDTTKL